MSILMKRLSSPQQGPNLHIKGRYNTPAQMPLTRIMIYPGTITYETMEPLVASDGAPIAATTEGTWGQLYAAGKM